eukprot:COSAG02_NODE_1361_length_13053_cov_26.443956_14_plen_147_part_00
MLMRRCGVEMNEAIFLLEAARGDVRAAAKLASSTTGWAAPAAHAGLGSLTAATKLALAKSCKTSPPEDAPGSPLDASAQWPSINQAMVAEADDWALVEDADGENAGPDETWVETWVELDLEVRFAPLASYALVMLRLPAGVRISIH